MTRLLYCFILCFSSILLLHNCEASKPWVHTWDTLSDMFYMHGNNRSGELTDAEVKFMASSFKIITFGNCFGSIEYGTTDEEAVLKAATEIKAVNPDVKVIFYFKSNFAEQIVKCSTTSKTWLQNQDKWSLRDDKGNIIHHNSWPMFDPTKKDFVDFWVGHLVDIAKQRLSNGKVLIDGFFLDGIPNSDTEIRNLTKAENDAHDKAQAAMIGKLQAALDGFGENQKAIMNALDSDYGLKLHVEGAAASMVDHFAIIQFLDHKTGKMIPEAMQHLLFEVIGSPENKNRTLEIKSWPGPLISPKTWPNNTIPKTTTGLRQMMTDEFNNALSYFLLIAEENHWWGYSLFWEISDYIPFGKDHTCPDNFYPHLHCKLGAPKGPAKRVSNTWVYTREFEYASVYVDLSNRAVSKVTWHDC